jgi:hypothetical protein
VFDLKCGFRGVKIFKILLPGPCADTVCLPKSVTDAWLSEWARGLPHFGGTVLVSTRMSIAQ